MSLAGRTTAGAVWSVAAGLGSRFVGLFATLLLTRYLAPSEYGEVAVAAIIALSLNQLSTLGVGVYLTAHPEADRAVVFHATLLHVGLGVVPLLLAIPLAHPLAVAMDAPGAARFLPLLALSSFVDRTGSMPERMALRALEFRRVSGVRAVGEIAYATAAIAGAIAGWAGMAIVAGNLVRALIRAGGFITSVKRESWLTVSPLRRETFSLLARHGFWVSLSGVSDMASRKWDTLIVSSLFGPTVAGTYNLAYNLAELPALQVGEPITDVLQVSYAHVKEADRPAGLQRSIALVALAMAPLAFGLSVVAEPISAAFFPARWAGLGPMLAILALVSFVRPLDGAAVAFLQARSNPRLVAIVDAVGVFILVATLASFGRASPLSACACVVLSFAARGIVYFVVLAALERIALGRLAFAALAAPLAGFVMALAVLGVQRALAPWSPMVRLAVSVMAGAIVYPLAALLLARRASRDFVGLLRQAILRRARKT